MSSLAHPHLHTQVPAKADPCLLSLDTSTQRLVIALGEGVRSFGIDEEGGARASARLLPAVIELLQRAGWALSRLDAVAFARGPGAFTGLRTAASAAQGLAFGLQRPVLPLDSLMIVAEAARLQEPTTVIDGRCVTVAMDARMDQIYVARYTCRGEGWQVDAPPALVDPETLAALWRESPPEVVAGSAPQVHSARLALPSSARVVARLDRAADALGAVARAAWRDGLAVDPEAAQPLYVRDKVAFTTAEREAQRMAKEGVR